MEKLSFKVSGINCQACTKLIKMDLEEISGVNSVDVDIKGNVAISADREISIDEAKKALSGSEYKIVGE